MTTLKLILGVMGLWNMIVAQVYLVRYSNKSELQRTSALIGIFGALLLIAAMV